MRGFKYRAGPVKPPRISNPYSLAEQAWRQGRLNSAFRLFLSAAKNGDYRAFETIGYFYDDGVGTKRKKDDALYWYRRAHRNGSFMAANNVGAIYRDRKDWKRAVEWFHRAVELGDGDANLNIAKTYLRRTADAAKALRYLKRTLQAKPSDVTDGSKQEARRLLKQL